jgi:hypothetical protein
MENLKHIQKESVQIFSLYLTVNTPHVHYKSVSLNVVTEIMTVCCRNATKHTNTLRGQIQIILIFKCAVCIVTTLLLGAKTFLTAILT